MIESHLLPIFVGYLATSLALVAEHIGLKQQPWRLEPPTTYVIGVLTCLAGTLIWALLEPEPVEPLLAALAFAVISMGGGKWVLLLYYLDARSAKGHQSATRQGELVGSARDILNELRGRGTDEQSRRN